MKVDYILEPKKQEVTAVDRLRRLLGEDVLLLPCNGKKPSVEWKKLTIAAMSDSRHLQRIANAPNIGVVLGERSGGLCVIDFDVDGEDDKFLSLNPALKGTLRTRGSRGSSLWLRVVGNHPGSTKLKQNGIDLGEWRADGNQSIIFGLHPVTGKPYRMLNSAQPIAIKFEQIKMPKCAYFPAKQANSDKNVTHVTEVTEVADVAEVTKVVRVFALCDYSNMTEDEIVRLCVPITTHQNNPKLFDLARGVKTLERQRDSKYQDADLKRVFGKWYRQARQYVRPDQSRSEYYEEFLQACDTATVALDEGGLMTAWQMAKTSQPPEALIFRSSAARMLVSVCYQLQQLVGDRDFFLACRSAGKLLKFTPTHTARLLRQLVGKKVLHLIEKGHSGKASRYRFIHAQKKEIIL